ncbi:glycosyltransferase [Phormidium sp. FACHB-592]|uniref:Glycosyltransferase n=1 Tax=Stenomitos frigidus AS-A4 TaxID=2933935 RepID=A0ABV0KL83_9CYAN|nr:glycosyltransferase [Phormidium sp. FACHB-592]MBD2075736.1 glycosyltransferase [Phormidium sp. FACHB-592]
MATAVLDLDLQKLPSVIAGLERYNKALALIRLNGKPIGKAYLSVFDGKIDGAELRAAVLSSMGSNLETAWLHHYLNWDSIESKNFIPPKATIAVCTRDRPEDARRCLDALMRLPDDGQEVLIVDNCPSTDETQRIVESYSRVRYVREDRPGLNNARNRALQEAAHEVIAFTDDDAVPDSNWLRSLLRNFHDPMVMCITGLTMPLELETEAQEWFERYCPFGKGFERVVFRGDRQNPIATGRVGAGANMAVRRSLLELVGSFDEHLDAGTPTCSGGDHEMFARILMTGYQIVYDPTALSWHRHRRTWEELRRALYGYGVGVYAYWTRILLVERDPSMFPIALAWFHQDQLPYLVGALFKRPGSIPLDLIVAELHGCLVGPWAYFSSRQRSKSYQS